jgi:signal transduction histidine kinase
MRNLLSRLLGENVELVTELGRDAAPVHMDPAQMRQLVLNLVLNARDAMPEGGRVTLAVRNCLACRTDGGHSEPPATSSVEFTVTDTGCGMDAGTRTHLFESFFTTKPPGQGSGLGLATVYRIVQKENGSIHVDSEPGKGTRVTVRLPCANPEPDQFMPAPQI